MTSNVNWRFTSNRFYQLGRIALYIITGFVLFGGVMTNFTPNYFIHLFSGLIGAIIGGIIPYYIDYTK